VEAMTLGTRVAVMHEGALQQVAPPMALYREPANLFVAGFIGSPGMNFVRGRMNGTGAGSAFEGSGLSLALPDYGANASGDVVLGVRPQSITITTGQGDAADGDSWAAAVVLVEALGSEQIVHLATGELRDLVAVVPAELAVAVGDQVRAKIPAGAIHLFDASTGRRISRASS